MSSSELELSKIRRALVPLVEWMRPVTINLTSISSAEEIHDLEGSFS